jgi:hypothetical protein
VDRTRPAQAVFALFELFGQPIMGQNLLHSEPVIFGHGEILVEV